MVTLKVADKDKYHKIKHYKTVLPKAGSKRYKVKILTIRKAPRAECARKDMFLNMFEIT